ncbi:hypothetical protein [Methylobacterium sp. JK268]
MSRLIVTRLKGKALRSFGGSRSADDARQSDEFPDALLDNVVGGTKPGGTLYGACSGGKHFGNVVITTW